MDNGAVDTLSRNDASSFLAQVLSTRQSPTETPAKLLQMLVDQRPDWTSRSWTNSFESILLKVEQIRLGGHIRQGRGVTSRFDEMGGLWESQQWRRCCAVCVIPGGWGAEAPHNQSVSGGSALPPYCRGLRTFLVSRHRLHYTLQGIKRSEAEKGTERRERLPITPNILRI